MTTPHPFRFGVVAPVLTDVATWRQEVRHLAGLGYHTVLMPDVPGLQPSPAPALALAAADTDLRVGTWVFASQLRPARTTAWEAHSLSLLTEGRFEMGLGTGRPGLTDEVRELGLPVLDADGRVEQLREVVEMLRGFDGDTLRTAVAMAVRGPRAAALAVELADTITIAAPPGDSREAMVEVVHGIRARRDVELAMHVAVVGETVSDFMAGPGTDPDQLRADDALTYLPADPVAAVDTILQRREEIGYSYVVVGLESARTLAPAVAELTGR